MGTFSESWYRVAGLKAGLNPNIEIFKQYYRGVKWFVLHDRLNNQFYRINPTAYKFVGHLQKDHTIEDIWLKTLELYPEDALGQEDVISLLSQLHHSNLLYFSGQGDFEQIFKRYAERRSKERKSKLLSILFIRIPLWDPNSFLDRFRWLANIIFSLPSLFVFGLLFLWGMKTVVDNWAGITSSFEGALAPDNIFLVYIGFLFVKIIHEFGHAFACKRFGGNVHVMGIMLLIFTPLPYIDVTSSWAFRNKWQRVLVGSSGMIFELVVASIAVTIWANTGDSLVHSLAYNVTIVASISTLIFNANPLLRFDGYYIFSDLLDIPNLYTKSVKQLQYVVERFAFGLKDIYPITDEKMECFLLIAYGIMSNIYRILVFTAIILFVSDKLFFVGPILALISLAAWLINPLTKLFNYLFFSGKLAKNRMRALLFCSFILLVCVYIIGFIPFSHNIKAQGLLESENYNRIFCGVSGRLEHILVKPGQEVKVNQPLLQFANTELELEFKHTKAQLTEVEAIRDWALKNSPAELDPIQGRIQSILSRLKDLQRKNALLTVKANAQGVWEPYSNKKMLSSVVQRGTLLGDIVDLHRFQFIAVVRQNEVSSLFDEKVISATIRIRGQAEHDLKVRDIQIIPFEQNILPSSSLGWQGGGSMATDYGDEQGLRTQEPFFEIIVKVIINDNISFLHGRRGIICLEFSPEPLIKTWIRSIRQLIQKKYKL